MCGDRRGCVGRGLLQQPQRNRRDRLVYELRVDDNRGVDNPRRHHNNGGSDFNSKPKSDHRSHPNSKPNPESDSNNPSHQPLHADAS